MKTMSKTHLSLYFLSLLILLFYISSSSSFVFDSPVVGLVACRPRQIQAFTQFKNEFDTRGCNHSDSSNGIWCDNSTGEITKLRLNACLSGTLKPNSSLFKMRHLRHLSLVDNDFNSSSIPSEFGLLNRLQVLSVVSSLFVSEVPSSFSNLSMLYYLNLGESKLTGSFPHVWNLTKLSFLNLANNHFSGTIPSSLLTMPSLQYLDVRWNNLIGSFEVPNSSTSSRLDTLYLGSNRFDEKILEPISKLIYLIEVNIGFLNTTYPIDLRIFSTFKSLAMLVLSGNKIYPASLSLDSYIPLTLQKLWLGKCGLKEFPNILKTLPNLEFIDIGENLIKGTVPEWLWTLPRVDSIVMSDNFFNDFEGSKEFLVNSSVRVLFIDSNNFEGPLPDLPLSINIISARFNNFTGEIPLSICNRSSLDFLDLSSNNFTGLIPHCLSNFGIVNLRKNNLEGSIPDVFHVGTSIQLLDVGFNQITGKLPRSLLNCSSLQFLNVENNNIEDTFLFALKALPNLQVLILSSNKFYGPISLPHQGSLGFSKLQVFMIADNKFSGSLSPTYFVDWKASSNTIKEDGYLYMVYGPTLYGVAYRLDYRIDLHYKGLHMDQVQVLNSYRAIDFSGNLLEGSIPESIGFLKALIAINLSNNAFTGHIPVSLANLKELESLDISRNQLSGTIPNGLGSLSFLVFINVSHNQLKVEIPRGTQITGQAKSSFEGNAGLCGCPLEKSCFDTSAPPAQHHKQEDEEEEELLNWKGIGIGYGPGVLFGLGIAQVIASYKPEWLAKIIGPNKRRNR